MADLNSISLAIGVTGADGAIAAIRAVGTATERMEEQFNVLAATVNKFMGIFASVIAVVEGGKIFGSIVSQTVGFDSEIIKLSRSLGVTTEQATAFKVALHSVGIDQDTAISAALRMAKTMGANSDAYKQIGVDIDGMRKSGKSNIEIMMATIQALGDYKGGLDRNAVAMTIFNKSWKDVQDLQKLTPEILEKGREEAEKLNMVLGPDGAEKTKQYKMAMAGLQLVHEAAVIQIGRELIPILTDLGHFFIEKGPSAINIFRSAISGTEAAFKSLSSTIGIIAAAIIPRLSRKTRPARPSARVSGGMKLRGSSLAWLNTFLSTATTLKSPGLLLMVKWCCSSLKTSRTT
jgi:hypothetical protein